ncbi:MAG: glycosyltransferase family 2 protein [Pseudomonadota bacterium]
MLKADSARLTVIIVNRNTADLLLECIEHVYRSDLPRKPQVIVVDNGSVDASVVRVESAFPDVEVIAAGRNLGFAAANNRGAERALGEYLLLVNTDAMIEPDCAGQLMELMEQDPEIGMVGPRLVNPDGSPQTSYEAVPSPLTETLNRSLLKRLFPRRYPSKTRVTSCPEPVETLIGAVMMIRRQAFEDVGGFDERYFFFFEETDLAVRMRKSGRKVVHQPGAIAVHLQGGTAKAYHSGARIEYYRSRYLFFREHYGPGAATFLRAVRFMDLTFSVFALGIGLLFTLGRIDTLAARFRTRWDLWVWHLHDCPLGPGLPRE